MSDNFTLNLGITSPKPLPSDNRASAALSPNPAPLNAQEPAPNPSLAPVQIPIVQTAQDSKPQNVALIPQAYDFDAAAARGFSNSDIVSALRQQRSSLNWDSIDATLAQNRPENLSDSDYQAWADNNIVDYIKTRQKQGDLPFIQEREIKGDSAIAEAYEDSPAGAVSRGAAKVGQWAQMAVNQIDENLGSVLGFVPSLPFETIQLGADFVRDIADSYKYDNIADLSDNVESKILAENPFDFNETELNYLVKTNPDLAEAMSARASDFRGADGFQKASNYARDYMKIKREAENEILSTDFKDATPELKARVLEAVSDAENFFKSDEDAYNDYKLKIIARRGLERLQVAINALNQVAPEKDIFSALQKGIFGAENLAEKTKYLGWANDIVRGMGFDGVGYDKEGNLYALSDGVFHRINENFFGNGVNMFIENRSSIVGSVAGVLAMREILKRYAPKLALEAVPAASKGAKIAKGIGEFAGYAGAGYVGSLFGGLSDAERIDTQYALNMDFQDKLRHAIQEGWLSVVGDAAGAVIGKGLSVAAKAINEIPNISSATIGRVIDYTPIAGFVKRAADGNAAAAQRLLNSTYTPEQQAAIKEFGDSFGGELTIGQAKGLGDKIRARFGEDSWMARGAAKIADILTLKNRDDFAKRTIALIRADDDKSLIGFLIEVANSSPTFQKTMRHILNQTTHNLEKALKGLDFAEGEVRGIFKSLEKNTKDAYNDAIEQVLEKAFGDKKVIVSREKYDFSKIADGVWESREAGYDAFLKDLADAGIPTTREGFVKFLEDNIYNPKGVTFKQLNNALKLLNSYYKLEPDPNFRRHIKNAIEGFLRDDIKQGISDIFAQNPRIAKEAMTLYTTALNDYAMMKDAVRLGDKLKIRDTATAEAKALDNIEKYLRGQGDDISNLTRLTKALGAEAAERVELNILWHIFQKSMLETQNVRVFDSEAFFKRLGKIKSAFSSPRAKDFIDIVSGFHTLFKNDALIAAALKDSTTATIGSSIATTIEGAAKFQLVKAMFANIVRLMPHIPFVKGLNEKVQGAAMRYHIKTALSKSIDVSDFTRQLSAKNANPSVQPATRKAIDDFLEAVNKAQDDIIEEVKYPVVRYGDNLNPQLPNPTNPRQLPPSDNGGSGGGGTPRNPNPSDNLAKNANEPTLFDATNPAQDSVPKVIMSSGDRLTFEVPQAEADELRTHFAFKNRTPLTRELRENEIAHALKSHGDEATESARGQIAITREDILENYPKITQDYTDKFYTSKGLIFVKQINGHFIVIEEALLGQDKLIFKTAWKTKGNYNRDVLLKNIKATPNPPKKADDAARQNANPSQNLGGDTRDNTLMSNAIIPKNTNPMRDFLANIFPTAKSGDDIFMDFAKIDDEIMSFDGFMKYAKLFNLNFADEAQARAAHSAMTTKESLNAMQCDI